MGRCLYDTINANLANHIFLTFLQFTTSFRIGNCSSSVLEFVNSEFIHFGFELDFVGSDHGNPTREPQLILSPRNWNDLPVNLISLLEYHQHHRALFYSARKLCVSNENCRVGVSSRFIWENSKEKVLIQW